MPPPARLLFALVLQLLDQRQWLEDPRVQLFYAGDLSDICTPFFALPAEMLLADDFNAKIRDRLVSEVHLSFNNREFDPHLPFIQQRLQDCLPVLLGDDDVGENITVTVTYTDGQGTAESLTSAAVGRFQGQVAAFAGHLPGEACYRCFVGDAFDAEDCDTCADDGMLGAMAGWVGSFAAMQAVKALLAGVSTLGAPGWSRLHILDGMEPGMRTIRIPRDPGCKACGTDHA